MNLETAALETFARNYWPAIYGFIRMKGRSPQEAEDLTQAFLAGLIEREAFGDLSEERGRFRSWLLASLTNFLRNEARDRNRLKRGGVARRVLLDTTLLGVEDRGADPLELEDALRPRFG